MHSSDLFLESFNFVSSILQKIEMHQEKLLKTKRNKIIVLSKISDGFVQY